ncbi:MAG TPA: carotenoid biosynthesis protein, partial [Candidatus Latescibacteria bacterium]|nr:carotenoid biosynthesis protein [Candidatus Latescibacterota bacterium]
MLEHPLAFLPFEALMAGLLFLCFRHALPFGAPALLKLAAGVVFGILLEWATIEQLDAYRYGTQYLFMIDTVPIATGVGWGVILYSAMYLTDHTNLNPWLRPVADALLALNIDLVMDAVAIRAGMWDWGKGLEHDYFGVPFENFWAWFWVIFCFSLSYRICYRLTIKYHVALAPICAIPLGILGV